MPEQEFTVFVCVDENGQSLGPPALTPEPDRFRTDGLAQVGHYVTRVLRSPASFASLIATTPDQQRGFGFWCRDGEPQINLHVERFSDPGREEGVRAFFAARRLTPSLDYLAGNGGVPAATRCLSYILPRDEAFVATLARELLREIYGLSAEAGLNFIYFEKPAAAAPPVTPAEIADFVERLLRAPSGAFAVIGTVDEPVGFCLFWQDGVPYLSVPVHWQAAPDREETLLRFFAAHPLPAAPEGGGSGEPGMPEAGRILNRVLPAEAPFIAALVRALLQEVYGLGPDAPLALQLRGEKA